MISTTTETTLDELYNAQTTYKPAADIVSQLAEKSIVLLVGATCQGKSTIMREMTKLNSGFGICGTFTSRLPRPDDDATLYTYYEHSDAGLAPVLRRIRERQVVNYAVNPFSKLLYGSELSDYPHRYNVGDFIASAIGNLRSIGFGSSVAITIVSDPDSWLQRFEERFPLGHEQRTARRDEAIQSFTWSLAQPDGEHFWVENVEGRPEVAAQTVIAISSRKSTGNVHARLLCRQSLAAAQGIS